MPHYLVTLIWRSGRWGWTESYYRESAGARQATDLGGAGGLVHFLALRSPPAELQAVRAEETDGLRRVYVREVHSFTSTRNVRPDVAAISVRCWIPFEGGGGRSVWIRGVPDEWVRRDAIDGQDTMHGELSRRLRRLADQIRISRLRGRKIVQTPWQEGMAFVGPHPIQATWTQIFTDTAFPLAVGDRVYFAGKLPCCGIDRDRPYWITEVTDAWLSVLSTWPEGLAGGSMRHAKLRRLEYDYPLLGAPEFREFTTHRTRGYYRPASWTWTHERAPIDPCGRVVDYLHQCYRTTIRPFHDDPAIELPAAWYWTREGAPEVPFEHPFGSRSWRLNDSENPLVGEQFERTRTTGTDLTGLDGVGLCGSADQWYWGPSVGDPGRPLNPTTCQPCCCGPGALVLAGGGAGGGEMEAGLPDGLLVHLRPEEVGAVGYADGSFITNWPAAPGTSWRAWGPNAPPTARWQGGPIFWHVGGQSESLLFSNNGNVGMGVVFPADFTFFVVAVPIAIPGQGRRRWLNLCTGFTERIGHFVSGTNWRIAINPNLTFAQNLNFMSSFLMMFRRAGNQGMIRQGDTVLTSGLVGTASFTLSRIASTFWASNPNLAPAVFFLELLGWPRALTEDEYGRVLTYLQGRYAAIGP